MKVRAVAVAIRGRAGMALAPALVVMLAITACGSGAKGGAATPPSSTGSDLVKAAQSEGELAVYGAVAPAVLDRVTKSFAERYNIKVSTVRMSSSQLYTRFANEAKSGNPGADVILPTFGERDTSVLVGDKLITPLQDAGIPGYPADYPKQSVLTDFGTAAVNYVPNGLAFNTDMVKGDEIPTDWSDIADPKWKGKLIAAYPNSSPNTLNFFNFLLETEGPDFLKALRANNVKYVDGESPAVQAVAAGEAALAFPGNSPFILPLADKGAPIKYQAIENTSGLRIGAFLAAKAKHPNAARLFLQYVLSEEGAAKFTGEPGLTSPHDVEGMKHVTPEEPTSAEREKEILKLLGEA